jgi:hypothetical protein
MYLTVIKKLMYTISTYRHRQIEMVHDSIHIVCQGLLLHLLHALTCSVDD